MIVTVYVLVVVVSRAVTTTVAATLPPSVSAMAPDVCHDATAEPCTLMVAPKWLAVGVSVALATALSTVTEYEPVFVANDGDMCAAPLI